MITATKVRRLVVSGLLEAPSLLAAGLFQKALAWQGVDMDMDEVECVAANLIYKKFVKGYISHKSQVRCSVARQAGCGLMRDAGVQSGPRILHSCRVCRCRVFTDPDAAMQLSQVVVLSKVAPFPPLKDIEMP